MCHIVVSRVTFFSLFVFLSFSLFCPLRQDDRTLRDLSRTSLLLEEQHRRARKAAESKLLRRAGRQFQHSLVSRHAALERASAATLKSQNLLATASLAEEDLRRRKNAQDKAEAEKAAQLRSLSRLQSRERRMTEVARAEVDAVERARELAAFRARERDLRWEREVLQPVAATVAETWAKADAAQARVAEEERKQRVRREAEMAMAETRQRGKLENAHTERNAYKKAIERERVHRVHNFYTSQANEKVMRKGEDVELEALERDFHHFSLTKPMSVSSVSSAFPPQLPLGVRDPRDPRDPREQREQLEQREQHGLRNHSNSRDNVSGNGNEYEHMYGSQFTANPYTETRAIHQELSPPAISRASQSLDRREQKRENVQLAIS